MSPETRNQPPVYLVIRYDDYGAAYGPACAARFDVEEMLQREAAAHGWPWLCSITPRQSLDPHDVNERRTVRLAEDQPRVALLRRAVSDGLCEPAVHGLTHHTWKQLPRWGTEFEGLPVEEQYDVLRTARREVEELVEKPVSVFVPPWNSYDEATVQAAGRAGLTLVSAGLDTFVDACAAVRQVPATVELQQLRRIMHDGRTFPPGSIVVLLTHGTDFVTVDPRYGYLRPAEFAPLVERAIQHFGLQVVPITRVPDLAGADLRRRKAQAAVLTHHQDQLRQVPIIGRSVEHWLSAHTAALLPAATQRRVRAVLFATLAVWFAAVALLASAPGWLCVEVLAPGPWRWAGLAATLIIGGGLVCHCGWNAFLKRYRRRWGARKVGLRTWTGLAAGLALSLSALLPGVLSLLGGEA